VTTPYGFGHSSEGSEKEKLILRDLLAIDRTILANERTVLAYFRTMLALLAAGASLIHFFDAWWALPGGLTLLVLGPVLFGIGLWRYRRVNRDLALVRQPPPSTRL
jgi:putative membrane protein